MANKKASLCASARASQDHVLVTVDEAADIARVCTRTLRRWCDEGRVQSTRPIAAGSGRRYVLLSSLLAFLGLADEA